MEKFSQIVSLAAKFHAASHAFLVSSLEKEHLTDIEPCHGDVFECLFTEDGLNLSELARRSGRSKSTVSVMVRRLEKLGYLKKEGNKDDSRALRIFLTEKGRELKPKFACISQALETAVSEGFTQKELATFEKYLAKALENFKKDGVA